MKTAIYIEHGVTQLVLTPENDWEKDVLAKFTQGQRNFEIYRGSFYKCQGGWDRQQQGDESLILRAAPPGEPQSGA